MMDRVISDRIVTARKHYPCDACWAWNRAGYTLNDCQTANQRIVVEAAQADRWKILPGQPYIKVTGIYEGRIVTFRARPGMDSVCRDLELYGD